MNKYQTDMFCALEHLVKTNEAFYHQDFMLGDSRYRIYNYRLASFTDFEQPFGRECRGHMFEIDTMGQPIRLAALPMEKFHNLNECPSTIGLDLTQVDEILLKADGSLMSTYIHEGQLKVKSKGSISSEQALAAMAWLERNPGFAEELHHVTRHGYTVNLEWCSPVHRIVIGYEEPHLKVINARMRSTGEYMSYYDLVMLFDQETVIERIHTLDPVMFVESIPAMTDDIEGYVIRLKSGQRVKIKTEKYLSLHHAKDSVNNPRRLYEAILDEGIDDLRSMFYTDVVATKMIDEMQIKVDHMYNSMVKLVEEFYETNKTLERKDYAIKGQAELDRLYFGLAMSRYLGQTVDYKAFMKSKVKELGIRDTQQEPVAKTYVAVDVEAYN